MRKFEMESFYVLGRINAAGKQEFKGTDSQSGGYPYWYHSLFTADRSATPPSLENLQRDFKYLDENGWEMAVLKCRVEVQETIPYTDAAQAEKRARRARLEAEIKKLQDQIEEL